MNAAGIEEKQEAHSSGPDKTTPLTVANSNKRATYAQQSTGTCMCNDQGVTHLRCLLLCTKHVYAIAMHKQANYRPHQNTHITNTHKYKAKSAITQAQALGPAWGQPCGRNGVSAQYTHMHE